MAEYSAPAADAGTRTTEEDFDFLSQGQSTRDISVAYSESIVDRQSMSLREKKMFLCNLCDKDLGEHLDQSAILKIYQCCVCRYTSKKRAFLQQHINIHCAKDICPICEREYTQGEPHYSETTCNVCKIEFTCKTFLDQHCVVYHERHFETHCWVCGCHISNHLNECDGKTNYICCACGYSCDVGKLRVHNKTHRPILFCIRCKEEYPAEEKDCHDKEFKCMFCPQFFKCQTILENHLKDHYYDLFSNCTSCQQTLDMHRKDWSYQCCVCFRNVRQKYNFKAHLYYHSGLRLFKCPKCEKRFVYESALSKHSKYCLPIQCEKCRARFRTNDSLNSHSLEKHTETSNYSAN